MKHVLFITPSRSIGGTNSSLSSVVSFLKDKCNIKVLVISSSGEGTYSFDDMVISNAFLDAYHTDYSKLKSSIKLLAFFIKILKRVLFFFSISGEKIINRLAVNSIEKEYTFDVVIGFSEGVSMRLASQFNVSDKVTWIHCDYNRAVPDYVNELSYYEKFNDIVCVSKYTKQKFLDRYPSLDSRTIYIYNLFDIDRINRLSEAPIDDKTFRNDIFTIVSMGRMDPVKGFSLIPKIASKLQREKCKFRWYIIGGPENEEFAKVKSEILRYDVADAVFLLGAKSNPYPFLKASDLYVSTSFSEACPMVFLEAKTLGLPILSADFGSASEFISEQGFVLSIDEFPKLLEDIIKRRFRIVSIMDNCHVERLIDNEMRNKLCKLFSDL